MNKIDGVYKNSKTLPFDLIKTGTVGNISFRVKWRDQPDFFFLGKGGGADYIIASSFGSFFSMLHTASVYHRRYLLHIIFTLYFFNIILITHNRKVKIASGKRYISIPSFVDPLSLQLL